MREMVRSAFLYERGTLVYCGAFGGVWKKNVTFDMKPVQFIEKKDMGD